VTRMMEYGNPLSSEALRIAGTALTLLIVYLRVNLYLYEKARREALWNNLIRLSFVFDSREFARLLVEIAGILVHPLPFCGPQTWQTCFLFVRLLLVLHLLRDFSAIYQMRKDILLKVFER